MSMHRASRWLALAFGAVLTVTSQGGAAQAVMDSQRYGYTRTSSFTYQSNGLLQSETIEPDLPSQCLTTSYTYDPQGNKKTATIESCATTSGLARIEPRISKTEFRAQAAGSGRAPAPEGAFATYAENALGHNETRVYDPRFGAVVSVTGPNSLETRWEYDDFGRKVVEIRADTTRTLIFYCWVNPDSITADSASAGCSDGSFTQPTRGTANAEVPANAVRFEHIEMRDSSATPKKIGAFTRTYFDRAGRKLRTVTESFDGSNQPASVGGLVVQDTEYDARGNAIITTQPYFLATGSSTTAGGAFGMTYTVIDAMGRPIKVYNADANGSVPNPYPDIRYSRSLVITTFEYDGLTTKTTDAQGNQRWEAKNADGKVVRVTDALGAQLVHEYDAFGNLIYTKDALQNVTQIVYDIRGRKLALKDPNAGTTIYCYDALGQLKAQQTSNQRGNHAFVDGSCTSAEDPTTKADWTTFAYDKLGRMVSRVERELNTTWYYDKYAGGLACPTGIGKLCQVLTDNFFNRRYFYDDKGRPTGQRFDVGSGPSMAWALSYDDQGRVASQTYPTGVKVGYGYTAAGYLANQTLQTAATVQPRPASPGGAAAAASSLVSGAVLWRADAVSAWGKAEKQYLLNGVAQRAEFDPLSGRTTRLSAGAGSASSVEDQRFTWDSLGRLTKRIDALGDSNGTVQIADTFLYDALGRLRWYQVSGNGTPAARSVDLQYNALGMLLYKTDLGVYSYSAQAGGVGSQPQALQGVQGALNATYGYDLNGNLVSATAGPYRSLSYTSFNLPDGMAGPGGSPKYVWVYGEDHQRLKEVRTNATGTRTTWFAHPDNQGGLGFEREEGPGGYASNRHYLSVGGNVIGVLVTEGALPVLVAGATAPPQLTSTVTAVKLEYWHKDHLGSLVATTDHLGNVTARYAYDPFGKRRYVNSTYDAFGSLVIDWTTNTNAGTDRGFTGHEHLDDLGVIHMNGRTFDPTLGRFMQPDPYIQDMLNLQGFDRYAYCSNSPLVCTDPTGYLKIFGHKFTGRDYRMIAAIAASAFAPQIFGALGGQGVLVVNGSLTFQGAALAGFASGAISTGNLRGALQGAFSAGAFYGVGNVLGDKDFFTNVGPTGPGSVGAYGVALHGVAGCVTNVAGGGKCGSGALSAAFVKALSPTISSLAGDSPLAGAALSATVGGTASVLGGGKFANGAVTGSFSYLFNYCAHNGCFDRRFDFNDAVDQWRNGNGSTVTDVKASELNLTDATYTKVKDGVYLIHTSIKFDTGAIYGTVIGDLNADGTMSIRPDTYDFDQKNPFKANTLKEFGRLVVRDVLTAVGAGVNGFGTPYRIEFTGSIPAPKELPK